MTRTINSWLAPATLIAAGAVSGVMLFAAPAAHATPPEQIESQCRGLGGTWTVHYGNEPMYSCCYKPLAGSGETTCDYYWSDGTFMGSLDPDTKPTLPPAAPGQFRPTVPPPQTAR
jgi:hypothetical protein